MMAGNEHRVLLFGGTFDPVHWGHLRIGRYIAEQGGFEQVVLLPSASPPHKPTAVGSPTDRLAMLQAAITDDPLFTVNALELERPGLSYTIDTIQALRERMGCNVELCWLIGADMLAYLPKWYRAAELVEQVRFVTALRRPWHEKMDAIFDELATHFDTARLAQLRSDTIDTPLIDISSTAIREALAGGGDITEWVPPGVAAYLGSHQLYH